MNADINMVDVTIHLDENLTEDQRTGLAAAVRGRDGVIGLGYHRAKPHLMVVEFNPDKLTSADLLKLVKDMGIHAEVIGL